MTLYVDVEDVLLELGQDPAEATAAQRARVTRRIKTAQNKVLLFLGRGSFTPTTVVVPALWQDPSLPPERMEAWQGLAPFSDRARYVSHVVNTDDDELFDVTFAVGLDLANDPELEPIKDFIVQEATHALSGDALFPSAPRRVSSVSAGGQSVSLEKSPASADEAGGALTIATLARFKRRAIGQSYDQSILAPWPYGRRL